MAILRIQSLWTNFPGAPGYTNWHFTGDTFTAAQVNAAAAAVRQFWFGIAALLPSGLSIVNSTAAGIYNVDGTKTGEAAVTTPGTAIVGAATAAYAKGTGAVVHWRTNFFSGGRQLVGRTFVVPLANGFDTDGSLSSAAHSSLLAAANTYRSTADPQPVVWSAKGASGPSTSAPIAAVSVPDRPAVLRSRRA